MLQEKAASDFLVIIMSNDPDVALSLRSADHERPTQSGVGPQNVNTGAGVQKDYNA